MLKLGNQRLIDAFGELGDGKSPNNEHLPPFEAREPVENLRKFAPRDVRDLPSELEDINLEPHVLRVLAEGTGIHAIAWYLPFRKYGSQSWGIYFDTFAMTRLSFEIGSLVRLVNPRVLNSEVRRVLYAEILRHEIEHAVQELLLAQAVAQGVIELADLESKKFAAAGSYRETVASYFEHLDDLIGLPKTEPDIVNLIRHQLRQILAPRPYDQWDKVSIEWLDSQYEIELGYDGPADRAADERALVAGKTKTQYLEIPTYSWLGNGLALPLTGADLRAQSLDCQKLRRFLVKGGLARNFNGELVPLRSSDHDLKISGSNPRPIKFGCHDWDMVPDKVVGELAAAVGLTRAEFVERIRRLL